MVLKMMALVLFWAFLGIVDSQKFAVDLLTANN